MVVDFSRDNLSPCHVCINRTDVEIDQTFKYLGVHLDNKLEWSTNTHVVYKKGLSWLDLLRRLKSFNVSTQMPLMVYQSVLVSAIFSAVVCWVTGI